MSYIFAYDGGGTKTRINVMDLHGNILFDEITTGSNIVSSGNVEFTKIIEGLFHRAKETLKINNQQIQLIYLGLSGADLKEDYQRLYNACKPIFQDIKHIIVNDAWIILRSGLKKPYGAVAICGTGTNSAAIDKDGKKAILRALSYTLGTFGGGLDIARDALHYAFRADELTYQDTILKTEIPKLLGKKNMEDCISLFYPVRTISKQQFGMITALVNECAINGDDASNKILYNVAYHVALQTIGVMKQLSIEHEEIPVVIGGRVFTSKAPVFRETFDQTIKAHAKNATIIQPKFTPVVGAYLFALDELQIEQTEEIESNLSKSGGLL